MFDAMNRVELQPLDQEFQCCAEGGLVEKVNLSRNGSFHVQRIFCRAEIHGGCPKMAG